jgi:signal transduction histidine kinase
MTLLRKLPFGAWTGAWLLATTVLSVAVAICILAMANRLDAVTGGAVAAGALIGLTSAGFAAFAGQRLAASITRLRSEAMRRLNDPSGRYTPPLGATSVSVQTHPELVELARTLEALHLRVRVADDVARRYRSLADTTSAGMSELLSGLVAAEESARGQLAAELHDTVAQTLQLARSRLCNPRDASDDDIDLAELSELVADAEDQLRGVMARTRPPALRDGDLAVAVLGLRDDLYTRYGLVVGVDWPAVPHALPLVTAVTVYRFFQEALLNVIKHADVDQATLALEVGEREILARVSDEGPGFDPSAVRPERGRHVGLGLLRERARLAGGGLEVESVSGVGTTLSLTLPRRPGADARIDPGTVDDIAALGE